MKILVCGGAGFIGSSFVRHLLNESNHQVLVYDKLTYAGNLASLSPVSESENYSFVERDICDASMVEKTLNEFQPDKVINFAAESHVDRSIDAPGEFIQTNIVGTFTLLNQCLRYWQSMSSGHSEVFRFHHVSTDEVYGSLGDTGLFTESSPYQPNSPYSASKASSDHLVRAWNETYGLPTLITNCSNNYGPYHFPEKLVPLVILNALEGLPLPIYGKGDQVRDWLYVDDHARALALVLEKGAVGETYNIGGCNERRNVDLVKEICALLDQLKPKADGKSYQQQIEFVTDRPGHDARYAIDATKIEQQLGWRPLETVSSGLEKTIRWYLDNMSWLETIPSYAEARKRRGGA